ncbi:MAG: hypothetical protein NC827_05925 [Candidatus Omnitrophica bacterium]|nr:hypothetical protein [Candidatus Omnitrophota bacterium]
MAEDIWRRIREYEEKIKRFEKEVEDLEEEIASFRARFPEIPHSRLLLINPVYAMVWFKRLSRLSWISRWKKRIEELKKFVPPVKNLRITVTFSIETGRGHEIFASEITCDTIVPAETTKRELEEIYYRIMNGALKYFWIIFDGFKDITKDKAIIWGKDVYDKMLKWCKWFVYEKDIKEEDMDRFLKTLEGLGGLGRTPEEYLTFESIIKIGVEEIPTSEYEPMYPTINLIIEKTEVGHYYIERTLYLSKELVYDIINKFGIKVEK